MQRARGGNKLAYQTNSKEASLAGKQSENKRVNYEVTEMGRQSWDCLPRQREAMESRKGTWVDEPDLNQSVAM